MSTFPVWIWKHEDCSFFLMQTNQWLSNTDSSRKALWLTLIHNPLFRWSVISSKECVSKALWMRVSQSACNLSNLYSKATSMWTYASFGSINGLCSLLASQAIDPGWGRFHMYFMYCLCVYWLLQSVHHSGLTFVGQSLCLVLIDRNCKEGSPKFKAFFKTHCWNALGIFSDTCHTLIHLWSHSWQSDTNMPYIVCILHLPPSVVAETQDCIKRV